MALHESLHRKGCGRNRTAHDGKMPVQEERLPAAVGVACEVAVAGRGHPADIRRALQPGRHRPVNCLPKKR